MNNTHGWTLVELLITLSIISLLFGIGTPTFTQSIQRSSEKVALTSLHHLIYYARNQAIRRSTYFTLCPSEDNIRCGSPWNKTLIVFSDKNKNRTVDEDDSIFRIFNFKSNTPCIEWRPKTRPYLQFKPTGAANGTAGHFRFCDTVNSTYKHKVVVSFNGRTSLKNL